MTRELFVEHVLAVAKEKWGAYFGELADEDRLRLAGIEAEVRAITTCTAAIATRGSLQSDVGWEWRTAACPSSLNERSLT